MSQVKTSVSPDVDLNSLFYFNEKFVLLYNFFLYSCIYGFLNLIREARQKGSGWGEGQSTLSIRDSCSSSPSDKALHCTATLHTRTVQYHNTEIRHYLYFPNQLTPATKSVNVDIAEPLSFSKFTELKSKPDRGLFCLSLVIQTFFSPYNGIMVMECPL